MKLRSQIFLALFLIGFAPLAASIVLNVPMIFDRLELFFQKAYLQNLRADFRDLDQHLASRHEMVRLLAKLPEPGTLLGVAGDNPPQKTREARAAYVEWTNHILRDQPDIVQILFLDTAGLPQFWLEREVGGIRLVPGEGQPDMPDPEFIEAALRLPPGAALPGRIRIDPERGESDVRHYMNLRLIGPIYPFDPRGTATLEGASPANPLGLVVINVDVGGMAHAYRNTWWVHDDGHYLPLAATSRPDSSAFEDFPGLERIFSTHRLGLWKGEGQQVLWVPLFVTERQGTLWVGREVDPSPIDQFREALEIRVIAIALVLLGLILVSARWFADRVDSLGRDLTEGVGRMLTENRPVEFHWNGPAELREVADKLTRLSRTHAQNAQALMEHARALETSNRFKSEFLANVSHELRTPLNSILLLSKLLAENSEGNLREEQLRQARVIHDAGFHLRSLIDNILDLSRIEAGRCKVVLGKVDVAEVVADVARFMRPQFEERGLTFEVEIPDPPPPLLESDEEKLRQILTNLLSNALKFTARGGVTVRLEATRGERAIRYPLAIEVRDTGIGIPPEQQEKIFHAFQQVDGSTRRRYGGTGLGLAISRQLADLLGLEIALESEPGKGSRFILYLPGEPPEEARSLAETAGEEAGRQGKVPLEALPRPVAAPLPVLLVEHEVGAMLGLTTRIGEAGGVATVALNLDEAREVLQEEQPSPAVVLIDCAMPDYRGAETVAALRREGEEGLRVILLHRQDEEPEPAGEDGRWVLGGSVESLSGLLAGR